MQALANGRLVLEGEIREPKQGAWSARLELDAEDGDLDGPVNLTIGAEAFVGWAVGEVEGGRTIVRVVGGQDELKKQLPARYYYRTTLKQVLDDILRETGETLDVAGSSAAMLSRQLARWSRAAGQARAALSALCAEAGGYWRITRLGRLVVLSSGQERWDMVGMRFVLGPRDPARNVVEVSPEAEPLARPGTVVSGMKVQETLTQITSGSLEQTLTLAATDGRVTGAAAQFMESSKRATELPLLYARWYPAKVVRQAEDGTLELYPDDESIRGNGITHVPIRHGLPGVTVKVKLGQKVILFFEDGDPKKPACALWPDGSSVLEVVLAAETKITLASETRLGAANAAHPMVLGDVLKMLLEQLTVGTAMGPSGPPLNAALFGEFLSNKHKLDG
jgi:hypothetical protein